MTTVINDTTTETAADDDFVANDEPGTELVAAAAALIGEVVDGPLHLNTGSDGQQLPFRAGLLDARHVHEPQGFKRTQMGELDDLIASVRLFGVRAPLVVRSIGFFPPVDAEGKPIEDAEPVEHFAVVDGLRRRIAAIAAERFELPCFIADTDDDIQLILQMLEVNDHHKDLEGIEQAEAYQMLLDFGLSDQQIADARRVDVSRVRTAIKARTLPATAQRALNAGTLTLDQALALEEFADDPDAQSKLLNKLGDQYDFKHELSRLRDKRAYARNRDVAKAHLVLESVDVTPKPRGFGYDGTAVRADLLLDADGRPVDIDAVKTQPGFHAFVEKDGGQAKTVVYCDDPAQRGYTRRKEIPAAHRGLSPEQIAAKELAEQQKKERLERLTLAATVRREFIVEKFGTAKGARALFVQALRTAALGKTMSRSTDLDELYRALGGSDNDTLHGAGEDRLRRSLVAKYICAQEYNLNGTTQPDRYWVNQGTAVAWYDELRQRGYPLTDDEQELYQGWTATAADDEDEDEEDDGEIQALDDEEAEVPDTAPVTDLKPMPDTGEQDEIVDVVAADEAAADEAARIEDADAVVIEATFDRDEVRADDTSEPHDLDEFSNAA
ncbi:ParB/RepB/Spo0J family partition protein [Actinoplanes sp. NPDC048988]|uniref:ParB/RepB/Spo0J family partition protein n=1 Tax=Actinoplanes sp. NPDC048988 TaxID=3363901 RepID=UPI003719CF18